MANDKLNKELVSRMMDDAAWKVLSKDFPWTEQLLEKYMNYVDWKEISRNNDVVWTKSLLEKFKHRLDWHELTSNSSTLLFTEDNIETFKDCWDWEVLSDKSCIDMTHELLIKYADRWNWAYIIDRYGDDSITYNEEFLERYGEYIPASELGDSKLWDCIIEKRIKALKQEILA